MEISNCCLWRITAALGLVPTLLLFLCVSSTQQALSEAPVYHRNESSVLGNNTQHFDKVRGVNLGGWLVLHSWITPSLFYQFHVDENSTPAAIDEKTFCQILGTIEAKRQLAAFRSAWVNETTFQRLADIGINTVRIPFGYWIWGDQSDFCTNISSIHFLDKAVEWAGNYRLHVILDMQGVSGYLPAMQIQEGHVDNVTLEILTRTAARYRNASHVQLVGLMNGTVSDYVFFLPESPLGNLFPLRIPQFYFLRVAGCELEHHLATQHVATTITGWSLASMDCMTWINGWSKPALQTRQPSCSYVSCPQTFGNLLNGTHLAGLEGSGAPEGMCPVDPVHAPAGHLSLENFYKNLVERAMHSFEQSGGWLFENFKCEIGDPRWSFLDAWERGWFPTKLGVGQYSPRATKCNKPDTLFGSFTDMLFVAITAICTMCLLCSIALMPTAKHVSLLCSDWMEWFKVVMNFSIFPWTSLSSRFRTGANVIDGELVSDIEIMAMYDGFVSDSGSDEF